MDNQKESDSKPIPSSNPFASDVAMSSSYSEISGVDQNYEKMDIEEDLVDYDKEPKTRPDSIVSYDGQFMVDENNPNMKYFVADNLEYKIKMSSPIGQPPQSSALNCAVDSLPKQFSASLAQLDSNVLNDLEIEAQYLAANIDNLTENLANLLHSISSITADNVDVYKNSVTKLTETMDSNIKSMYTIIAKSEEISKSMKSAEALSAKIRDIRKFVDMLEAAL